MPQLPASYSLYILHSMVIKNCANNDQTDKMGTAKTILLLKIITWFQTHL